MNIWLTSDTHFGHTNIAGPKISNWTSGYRDFNSVHEMNMALVDGINKYVKEDDILLYADSGCQFKVSGIQRMKEYIEIEKNLTPEQEDQ